MAIQALLFAWLYLRILDTRREARRSSALGFGTVFGLPAWSFTTQPLAAKYQMSSVPDFRLLETGFALLRFAVVAPIIALACRERRAT